MSELNLDYGLKTDSIQTDKGSNQEWAKVIVLLGLAVYFTYVVLTGNITNYVNERFAWLSYVAIVIYLLLGLATALGVYLRQKYAAYDFQTHQNITWPIIVIVALPLLIGTLIPSRPLGAEAVNGNISLSVASGSNANLVAKDAANRNVLDWLRAFGQSPTAAAFDGEEADVIGFIYREPGFPEDHFMIARFTVSCCVADAGAIGLPVYTPEASTLRDGEWVRVQGAFQAGIFRDTKTPILQASLLEVVEQPEHPYLYP